MPNQISDQLKSERLMRLQALQNGIQKKRFEKRIGSVEKVLVEGLSRRDPAFVAGRNDANITVNFKGGKELIGRVVKVKITEVFSNSLRGKLDS